MILRTTEAVWNGDINAGQGVLLGGVRERSAFSLASRLSPSHSHSATSPEEMLAAAHSACYSMALAAALQKAGFTPRRLIVSANVLFNDQAAKPGIASILLQVSADVPEIDEAAFIALAKDAKSNCPLSLALRGVEISLEALLSPGSL